MSDSKQYVPVIGLEVHAQLSTKSKIYAGDATTFGESPNTNISVISLGHPGTLPKLNKTALEFAMKMGVACQSRISERQIFDRKNYFYPDLPKGYQLTQDRTPACVGGFITIDTKEGSRSVKLNRIHIEEDAGKLLHMERGDQSQVDFNRAGVALIEIVTEPDMHTAEEAGALLAEIRKMVRYLEICDGNMEEGSLRCDANVSVKLAGDTKLGKKVEIKNMNSIRNVQHAITYEIARQVKLLEGNEPVISETRLFDASRGTTHSMRTKEELNDYRYFPDPDLSPVTVSKDWLNAITASMPELPRDLQEKFVAKYKLPAYDAVVLTESRDVATYFEELCALTTNYKAASNWLMGPVKSYLNENKLSAEEFQLKPRALAGLIALIDDGKVNFSVASQKLFPELVINPSRTALEVAEALNVLQDSNADAILPIVKEVIKEFPLKVEEYRNGKKGIVSMLMGEVMKRSKGKADPRLANELLIKNLE